MAKRRKPPGTIKLDAAQRRARDLVELLKPACRRIIIAGSIRRCCEYVKDIELVAEPIWTHTLDNHHCVLPDWEAWNQVVELANDQQELFDAGHNSVKTAKVKNWPLLASKVEHLVTESRSPLAYQMNGSKRVGNGPRYKKLVFDGVKVDLFIVRPDRRWGTLLAIRTGPAEFSQMLMTKRSQGGALPDHLEIMETKLIYRSGGAEAPTNTEAEYFQALGIPCMKPRERTPGRLYRILDDQKHGRQLVDGYQPAERLAPPQQPSMSAAAR